MRVIISGGGDIGYMCARELAPNHDLFVIEQNPALLERLEQLDVQIVSGTPTSLEILREAQAAEADFFIACAHSDEVNIISALAVKQLGKAKTFCFVNKAHYFETFLGELGEHLVIDNLVWPEKLLAENIAQIITVPGATDVKVFEKDDLKLLEYRLKSTDPGVGSALKDLNLPNETLVTAIIREDQVIIPSGATTLAAGDKIIFMGLESGMRKLEHRYNPKMGGRLDVIIVGGGNVGFMLAEQLAELSHVKLKIIEKSAERCKFLAANLPDRVLVLQEDGTDVEFLVSQQIQACHCLVALTGTDERNLLVSLLAKQLKVPNVVTQTMKPGNIAFFEKVGVDVALSAHYNAIKSVVRRIDSEGVDVLTVIEKGKADIVEVVVPADFQPRRLMDLHLPEGVIIAAIRRSTHTIVPHGNDKIKPKDRLRVFCASGRAETLVDYLTAAKHEVPSAGQGS